MAFDGPIADGAAFLVKDHAGDPLEWTSKEIDGVKVRLALTKESAERLAEGGRIQVLLRGDDNQINHSWPYHLAQLRGRLDRVGQRDRLRYIGDLPEQDSELYELLQELDATLIIDRASVWRIAKGNELTLLAADNDGEPSIRLEDLDWTRVRRDHRYSGYFGRGGPGAEPTDIQVILAAIAGRLGDIGIDVGDPSEGEDELAYEGDTTSFDGEDEREDELEDELLRRRLPISTRTRMAFDRFSRRYSEALADSGFIEELGPVLAATNATIFNHLLTRLLERNAVSPSVALGAQLATWVFLWGGPGRAGIAAGRDEETAEVVRQVLRDGHAKVITVRGLAAALDRSTSAEDVARLRELAPHLLVDDDFALDVELLEEAAGAAEMAGGLLDSLARVASPHEPGEIIDVVVGAYGIARGSVHWRAEPVRRARANYDATTFVVTSTLPGLTSALATEMLGRVVVAATFADHPGSYWRIRFEGNGRSVAFWDADGSDGVVMVDGHDEDLELLEIPWPSWVRRIDVLRGELVTRSHVAQQAG